MPWNPFKRTLSSDRIRDIVNEASQRAGAGDEKAAYEAAQPLLSALPRQQEAALALVSLVNQGCFAVDESASALEHVLDACPDDRAVLAIAGVAASSARDWKYLNDPPPDADVLIRLVDALQRAVSAPEDEVTRRLHYGLACTCRTLGRSWDETAERSYRAALRAQPDRWQLHYDLGLFYKIRGRFAEGMAANQEAAAKGGAEDEAVRWNLGICATGAREAEVALRVWKDLSQKIELGRFGLPEGGYPSAKVRLAEHPLAERTATEEAGGPGLEETIWIERLSPCHGIVRSVLYGDLGVDYGDVILFDGAPITRHEYGGESVPVFPHLATLERREYQLFDFAGTQSRRNEIADLSKQLPMDAVVYSHTEQFVHVCKRCWENPEMNHQHEEDAQHHVIMGRMAAPPELSPADLQASLDAALDSSDTVQLMAPGLSEAVGDSDRAAVERRRYDMLVSSQES